MSLKFMHFFSHNDTREKLVKHIKPSSNQSNNETRVLQTPNLINPHHQGRMDLRCDEVISPILPVEESPPIESELMKQTNKSSVYARGRDVLVIDDNKDSLGQCLDYHQEKYPATTKSTHRWYTDKETSEGSGICEVANAARGQTDVQVTEQEDKQVLNPSVGLLSAPDERTSVVGAKEHHEDIGLIKQKTDKKTTDKMVVEWKAFLGGMCIMFCWSRTNIVVIWWQNHLEKQNNKI